MNDVIRICLLGFGEVGQTLAADLLARGFSRLSVWDTQFADPDSAPTRASKIIAVRASNSAEAAISNTTLVISAVTADQDIEAARSATSYLQKGCYFLDLNSVSPGVKVAVSHLVEAAGGRYVEAAIMSPISPRRIGSAMLFGGTHARRFLPLAQSLGFSGAEVFAEELGRASAAKMCRSVVIKGMEALLAESLLSARYYGVEDTVLESLQDLFPAQDWPSLARYMISRSLLHGRRRAEEMREVAKTVGEAGIDPWMSTACVERQQWAARYRNAVSHEQLTGMLDALLAARENAAC